MARRWLPRAGDIGLGPHSEQELPNKGKRLWAKGMGYAKGVYGLVEACGACVIQAHAVHARMCTQMAGNQPDPRREACPAVVFVLDAGG